MFRKANAVHHFYTGSQFLTTKLFDFLFHPFILLLVFFIGFSSCQKTPLDHDPVVYKFLQEKDLDFILDEDGDFIVSYPLSEGQYQDVWIRSRVNIYENQRVREIFSVAQIIEGSLPRALANQLLIDSYQNRFIGSWAVVKAQESDEYIIIFLAKVLADPYFPLFEAAMREAASASNEVLQLFTMGEVE